MNLEEYYIQRIEDLKKVIGLLQQKKKRFGAARLILFITILISFFVILSHSGIAATVTAIVLLLIFLFIVGKDIDNTRLLNFQKMLLSINEEELKAIRYDFSSFDDGSLFFPPEHPYASDLDIFGPHSLFQFLNRTASYPGNRKLAEWLLEPADKATIIQRQEAIKELKENVEWRQHLLATGKTSPITWEVFQQLKSWTEIKEADPKKSILHVLAFLFPLITLGFIIAANLHALPWNILWSSFCAHLILLWRIEKRVNPAYERLSKSIDALESFRETLKCIGTIHFNSPLLLELQQECEDQTTPAFELLDQLKKILARMHLRLNPLLHFPVNLAIFIDWHSYLQLTKWKNKHQQSLLIWVNAYASFETLSSFANMAFNHPDWCTPQIKEPYFHFSTTALGHPLIPGDKRVCSDLTIEGTGKIILITGSNMAGKSTFLRTTGINMILAMAGSNVCANAMTLSEIKILSSMRIADNLEENISTFYAELKKLESILKRVRAHENVFLLLDEILRGTNSQDRHAGARALIREFLRENTVGMVATHDLPLTEMEKEYTGQVVNYHFDVQVKEEELLFDYKLKKGICTSMNASILMRKIGIEV